MQPNNPVPNLNDIIFAQPHAELFTKIICGQSTQYNLWWCNFLYILSQQYWVISYRCHIAGLPCLEFSTCLRQALACLRWAGDSKQGKAASAMDTQSTSIWFGTPNQKTIRNPPMSRNNIPKIYCFLFWRIPYVRWLDPCLFDIFDLLFY